jgi:hypothetical protein
MKRIGSSPRQFEHFNVIMKRDGVDAAKYDEVVATMLAATFWLDEMYGARATYQLLQQFADQSIALP